MLTPICYYENLATVHQIKNVVCLNLTVHNVLFLYNTVTSMHKLKIAFNNGLRLLNLSKYNSVSEMFIILNIISFGELLRKYVFRFRKRIITSDNSLFYGIVNSAAM